MAQRGVLFPKRWSSLFSTRHSEARRRIPVCLTPESLSQACLPCGAPVESSRHGPSPALPESLATLRMNNPSGRTTSKDEHSKNQQLQEVTARTSSASLRNASPNPTRAAGAESRTQIRHSAGTTRRPYAAALPAPPGPGADSHVPANPDSPHRAAESACKWKLHRKTQP